MCTNRRVSLVTLMLLSIAALTFSSCSKDKGGAAPAQNYYFRANVGGKKIDFHTVNFQGGGNDDRWEQIVIGGYETSYPTTQGAQVPPSLDFEIWRLGGNIGPGTYATPAEQEMIARYAIQTKDGTQVYNTSNGDDVFTVNIETISKKGIKGTFSGTVRDINGNAISITEGVFDLPYETIVNP